MDLVKLWFITAIAVVVLYTAEGNASDCKDMVWPGGQNKCPELAEILYDTKEQFCSAEYYKDHCCETCRDLMREELMRRRQYSIINLIK